MNTQQPPAPSFAERYEAILKVYDMTPKALSELLDEPIAKFYRWTSGVQPRPKILKKMLEALPGLSENYLKYGVGPIKVELGSEQTLALLDPAAQRLLDFINERGLSTVAKAIGKHPQVFYNLRDGRSKASLDTMREVAKVYSDLDLNWIILGEASPTAPPRPATDGLSQADEEELARLRAQVSDQNDEIKVLREDLRQADKDYKALVKRAFPSPNGLTPALFIDQFPDEVRAHLGFQPKWMLPQPPTGKVRTDIRPRQVRPVRKAKIRHTAGR